MALNVKPSQQKPVPGSVPTEGPCDMWDSVSVRAVDGDKSAAEVVVEENKRLKQRIKDLEDERKTQCPKSTTFY